MRKPLSVTGLGGKHSTCPLQQQTRRASDRHTQASGASTFPFTRSCQHLRRHVMWMWAYRNDTMPLALTLLWAT